MGCDIHAHVEVKVNGKWEHYSTPRLQRNYELFGFMAGVRNEDVSPIAEPKGLPDDISLITKIDYNYDEPDAHTESWLNKDEIRKLCKIMANRAGEWIGHWEHTQLGYVGGNAIYTVGDPNSGHPKEYEDVRIVFWFYN